MTQSLVQNLSGSNLNDRLQACLSLAHEVKDHTAANQAFEQLQAEVAQSNPQSASLLQALWQEVIASRRSAAFWQKVSDTEKQMTEQLAASHLQLQQNYLRLIQEQ